VSNWAFLNAHRVTSGAFRSGPSDGFNGAFCLRLNGLPIRVIASDGMGWQHVSVSIHGSSNPPSWSIMCQVKELFWNDEEWVVQFHPAKSEYVNNHLGCLHLWRPTSAVLPVPDAIMVGIKEPSFTHG
jgi:hypothetical protein